MFVGVCCDGWYAGGEGLMEKAKKTFEVEAIYSVEALDEDDALLELGLGNGTFEAYGDIREVE